MKTIATLTMNPTIDVAYEVGHVIHTQKMRTQKEHYDPGGGGINVSRVFARLGGNARCCYLSGGATGVALDGLLDLHQLVRVRIPIKGQTRVSTSVLEAESGKEYRFVPPGPTVTAEEWRACLEQIEIIECDYLVASGSLPKGVPDDFYSRVSAIVRSRGIKMVLDTSGPALRKGLAGGGILLVKPSLGELQELVGQTLDSVEAIAEAASGIVRQGRAEYVAVTLGHNGALLAHKGGTLRLPAVAIEVKSAVGAGDSFLAAMVFALASGWETMEAFRFGLAAGAAAVLTPGTGLSRPADIQRLYAETARN
ncbi:MAG: 1-phosphofructokinase family hexose kinase [Novosphingobium sp.]